jgi:riboflavin kinase/FMN adenylyltransferase
MEIVAGHQALTRRLREPAVALGNFDGVHLGHQALFKEALAQARTWGGEAVALTFFPHPAKVLNPSLAPPLICPLTRRLERIAATGIDVCVVEPFTLELAALAPETFVDRVLVGALGVRLVCIGQDFTFGRGRAGTVSLLSELGQTPERHFTVQVIPPVTAAGMQCSSTKVREFVLEGRVEGAAVLLGRDPEVEGVVVAGAGRGRTIGIPTANLQPENELVPAPGVYAGWAEVCGGAAQGLLRPAAINIGHNPTFNVVGGTLHIEAHLLDYHEPSGPSLLGARLRLGFRRRLRAEQRFPSVEALVQQIHEDIQATRALGVLGGER